MPTHDDSISFFAGRKTWVVVWLVFLSIVIAIGWTKSAENSHDERALRDWEVEHAELEKAAVVDWNRRMAEFGSLQGMPGSQKELEDELNGGAPFEFYSPAGKNLPSGDTRDVFIWTDPKYGAVYTFYFTDGIFVGLTANGGGVNGHLHPRPNYSARSNSAESLRQRIARFSTYIWCAAIFCWLAARSWRLLAAQIALAAAITSGMAWLVNPFYSITWQGVFSNDSLFFAVVMLAISAALLGITLGRAAASTSSSPAIRFRLLDLLMIITASAILLALGPFGYVALSALLATFIVFASFFLLVRAMPVNQVRQ